MQERVFFGGSYRYGFNGHEKEIELNNESTSAYFWFYESALGRRLNLDPKPIVAISPYACFVNNAILFIDLLGDEIGMNNMTEKAKTTLKENWSKNTGLTLKIKDDGSLDYEKDSKGRPLVSKELKSSKIARRMLINSINSKTKVEFYDRSDQPSAQQFDGNRNHINLNIEEIESVQSSCSPNMTKESWSVGMVAFHELYHWKTDKDDPESGDNYSRGPIVKKMNRIEKELGLDQRFNYSYFNKQRIFNSTNTVLAPCKVGQIYENRLGLNNFTTKWEKEEHSPPRIDWPYCKKVSVRDKQQLAGSTTFHHRYIYGGKRCIFQKVMTA